MFKIIRLYHEKGELGKYHIVGMLNNGKPYHKIFSDKKSVKDFLNKSDITGIILEEV